MDPEQIHSSSSDSFLWNEENRERIWTMSSEVSGQSEERLSLAMLAILLLIGIVLLVLSLLVGPHLGDDLIRGILIGLGASFVAASIIGLLTRYVTPREYRIEIVRGHVSIYKRFQQMLTSLSEKEPHTIRSLNSCPPEESIGDRWDEFLLLWLKNHPDSVFHRVIVFQPSSEWKKRLAEIKEKYSLSNYHEYRYEGPPVMEMFLVDEKAVLLSFSTHGGQIPRITEGIIIRDTQFCKLLKTYHEIHLRIGGSRGSKGVPSS